MLRLEEELYSLPTDESFRISRKTRDPSFNATVPLSYLRKKRLGAVENALGAPLFDDHALVYWVFSNLKNLMNSLSESSRVRDFKQDFAPCTAATIHAFGITNGPVTFSIKEDGAFSTSAWNHLLGNEWDKVADGTAVVTSLKFKDDKTSTLNVRNICSRDTQLHLNFKTTENYRMHVRGQCSYFQIHLYSVCIQIV